ncbi:MAG: potassium-transporting ATPase subunit KdpA [Dehalococcoidia bacterium]
MTTATWALVALYTLVLVLLAKPLGVFMAAVYEGRRTWLHPVLRPVETAIYRVAGITETEEHSWKRYLFTLLAFNLAGFLVLYAILRMQGVLPLNPQGFEGVKPSLAFNAAASFITNTNWQSYGGETTLSYFSQMVGLTYQNFVSAAIGMAALVALVRGLARTSASTLGNFWVDLVRGTLYILLPASVPFALFLVSQGVVQTFAEYREVQTLEGGTQLLALGPAASQIAIKQLGTNGGGFFNVNSAHPFENPTIWSNFAEMLALLLIPAGLVHMYGKMVGSVRHGWVLLCVMASLMFVGAIAAGWAEQSGNPQLAAIGVEQRPSADQAGGNMEGKEVRFGAPASTLWAVATTDASNGSVNAMHDSFTPLGGLIPLANMATGEVVFGGVGSGMYGAVMYVLLTVFIAGLMVGRTPEYLGKKVEAREMKAVMAAFLLFPALILGFAAVAVVSDFGLASLNNAGPHGLSEVLYAFISGAANNGSAFAGLNANTTFYNLGLGVSILLGRFIYIIAALVIAGAMVRKRRVETSLGTFPVDGPTFGFLLTGIVAVLGLLTFFPAFALGPVVEHLMRGDLF